MGLVKAFVGVKISTQAVISPVVSTLSRSLITLAGRLGTIDVHGTETSKIKLPRQANTIKTAGKETTRHYYRSLLRGTKNVVQSAAINTPWSLGTVRALFGHTKHGGGGGGGKNIKKKS
jgi:hypothetical protein